MDLPINTAQPLLMHIDLNSCFASIEQQANPLLRGKVVVIAAYDTSYGAILSPSIEAKTYGIKVGMHVSEARMRYPNLIVRVPDPPKYREAHNRFMRIFRSYSPSVVAKSIDEAVIDFTSVTHMYPHGLISIAKEIKQRIKEDLGIWIRCSIGIAPNRFLAKLGASLHKPDGLTVIDHTNLRETLQKAKLLDFCGINVRYQLRLNRYGIYTPLQFLDAPLLILQKQAFQSIGGYYWYLRIRGWEADNVEFERKSYGQQYAITPTRGQQTTILGIFLKLCEKMGRRLRADKKYARGIHVGLWYQGHQYWHHGEVGQDHLFTTYDLFQKAKSIYYRQPRDKIITKISVQCFDLHDATFFQDNLFDTKAWKRQQLTTILDTIHDKWGDYVVYPATMMGTTHHVLDRIAFGKSGLI